MPFVRVEIIAGKTPEYKAQLLQAVHDALMLSLGIPDDDRFQRLYELNRENFERKPANTDSFTFIELTLFPGRSAEIKKAAITEITRLLGERLSIPSDDVYIIISEQPLENWGLRGKQASEMQLGYKK